MKRTLKAIFADYEFWLILAAAIGAIADAEGKFRVFSFSTMTIVAMFGLVVFHIKRKVRLQRQKRVPFLIVIGKPDDEFRDTRNEVDLALTHYETDLEDLKNSYGVTDDIWIYHQEHKLSTRQKEWKETILKIQERFWKLAARLPGRKIYQIIMNAPSTLALALGATIGSRNEYIFFHYMAGTGENPYHPVVDFSKDDIAEGLRILSTRVTEYHFIQTTGFEQLDGMSPSEILVAIELTGHRSSGDVTRRSQETNLPMFVIRGKDFKGSIPLTGVDWILIAREISSILLDLAGHPKVIRMHLFLSIPLALAFCVGTALGKFVRATVYNYFPNLGKYSEVYKLEEL